MRLPRKRSARASRTLEALTSGALVLSGLASQARADAPIERATADYDFSFYQEDDLEGGAPGGETERYSIEMHQFSLRAPFRDRMELGLELTYETMSGASPWYVAPDLVTGAPIQFMSQATIEDTRTDLLVSTSYYYDDGRAGFSAGYSTEKDYTALNFAVESERSFNEKNTTLSWGFGLSLDEIEPTDGGSPLFPTRPSSEEKKSYSLAGGLTQVLGRNSVLQSGLTLKLADGYLADPYKMFFVDVGGGQFLADGRPDDRLQLAWLTRVRQYVPFLDGALHVDYQYYVDDWDVSSHTVALAFHRSFLDERLSIAPSFRYYSQTEADFYAPFGAVLPADGVGSSDYRLSAYGAFTFGLEGTYAFRLPWTGEREWQARLAWERYLSDGAYAIDPPDVESPGLASWNVVSVGLSILF